MRVRTFAVVLATCGLLAAACGGDDDPDNTATPTTDDGSTATSTQEPVVDEDATVRFAWVRIEPSLDPHKTTRNQTTEMLFDPIVLLDQNLEIQPGIAETFEFSDDLMTLTLGIRDNAFFGDGTPVDAEAVRFSIARAQTLEDSLQRNVLSTITNMEVVDDRTLVLTLSRPDSGLLYAFADGAGSVVNPAVAEGVADLTMVENAGSTPYRLVEFEPGQKVVVERRPDAEYWDPDAFRVKRIEITVVPERQAVVNGLLTDEFDVALVNGSVEQAERDLSGEFDVAALPSDSVRAIILVPERVPDVEVRQAIARGIDRRSIAENGISECTYASQQLREGRPGYIEDYDPYAFDPDAAAAVLEDAGLSLEAVIATGLPQEETIAQLVQEDLGALGVEMTISPLDVNGSIGAVVNAETDAAVLPYSASPDIALTMNRQFFAFYQLLDPATTGAELAALIGQANSLPVGSDERVAVLENINEMTMDLAMLIPVCHLAQVWAWSPNLHGIEDQSLLYAANFSTRYWFVTA